VTGRVFFSRILQFPQLIIVISQTKPFFLVIYVIALNHLYLHVITKCLIFFFCRSIYATYDSDVQLRDIDLLRFTVPTNVFLDHEQNPENTGFCTPHGVCLPSGLLNVSSCKQGKYYNGMTFYIYSKYTVLVFLLIAPHQGY
jgi:hypothetical protein